MEKNIEMTEEKTRLRCRWCNLANPLYVRYHDEEWGVPCHDDHALYELLILESFQAGLSWETVLNKRQRFRKVYDGFDLDTVCAYGEEKIAQLLSDEGIIRNRLKIRASIKNSRIFRDIQEEYGSFDSYIWGWTGGQIIHENDPAVRRRFQGPEKAGYDIRWLHHHLRLFAGHRRHQRPQRRLLAAYGSGVNGIMHPITK